MCLIENIISWIEENSKWLGVVATFCAVFVALFRESLFAWLKRPKLEVEFLFEHPDCQMEISYHWSNIDGKVTQIHMLFFRIRVKNCGNTAAKNVEVFASKLSKKSDDNLIEDYKGFLPMYLKWSHTESTVIESIPAKIYKMCDLGKIIDPSTRNYAANESLRGYNAKQNEAIFSFEVFPKPNSCSHLIEKGNYQLEVVIGADNCKPIKSEFGIEFDGKWFAGDNVMMDKHVIITKLK